MDINGDIKSGTDSHSNSDNSQGSSDHHDIVKLVFDQLITESSSVVKRGNMVRVRKYTILKQNQSTEVLAKKLYEATELEHGFHFKNHYIFRDSSSGSCTGNIDLIKKT